MKKRMLSFFVALSLLCVFVVLVHAEEFDWPCWRGPSGDGISQETDWNPKALAGGPEVLWTADIGMGHSNVAIKDNRLYAMGSKGVFCFDAGTGKENWRFNDIRFSDPSSTPATDGKYVYGLQSDGTLFCLKAKKGKLKWMRDLVEEKITDRMKYGHSTSPIIEGDLLLLSLSTSRIALNKKTGKTVWMSEHYEDFIKEGHYATPVLYRKGDRRHALMFSGEGLYSVEVKTGEQLWFHEWLHFSAADPVLIGEKLFLSTDSLYPRTVLFDISGEAPVVLWRNKNMCNQFSTCVHVSGYLYGSDGDAGSRPFFRCIDASSGEVMWEKKMTMVSLTAANNKLIMLEETGVLHIAEATPSAYEEISSCDIPIGRERILIKFWTPPVFCNGKIYCRNWAGDLICLDVSR